MYGYFGDCASVGSLHADFFADLYELIFVDLSFGGGVFGEELDELLLLSHGYDINDISTESIACYVIVCSNTICSIDNIRQNAS